MLYFYRDIGIGHFAVFTYNTIVKNIVITSNLFNDYCTSARYTVYLGH